MKLFLFLLVLLESFFISAQHQDKVDFVRGEIVIRTLPKEKRILGEVAYTFKVLSDVDSVFLDAQNMHFSTVKLNGANAEYSNTDTIISIHKKFKKGRSYKLFLDYSAIPKQTVYFLGWDDRDMENQHAVPPERRAVPSEKQVWTQGQGKYTSHWLPSFDDMEEKVEFDLNITFDASYEVIANGKLISAKRNSTGKKSWQFDMQHPMSSYLLAFAIGNYEKQELVSKSGIPIQNFYYPKDSLRAEPTYRYTRRIFDFLEDEIGVPYPWQNYKQIPVHDFLYAGMENTGTTIFSDGYVIDSTAFVDKNYVNVNAHELAHQWFGDLVTEKDGNHHWLQEGFATYYAYLAEREIFGEDHFYWKLHITLMQLQSMAVKGEGESLLNPKASSLTFYEKGALALFMLREQLGDKAFRKGIQKYLQKYSFKNVTVSNFLEEMENASGSDLSDFKKNWLDNSGIPYDGAKKRLAAHCASLRLLYDMERDLSKTPRDSIDYAKYWNSSPSIHLKEYILEKYQNTLSEEIIEKAFASDTVTIRQALSLVDDIKRYPKAAFESLLNDKSYVTVENTLFKLWQAYPQDRKMYLDKTRELLGLPNKNLRLLWLTLAMLTEDYQGSKTKVYFDELSGYTDPRYSFEIRQGAFFYLKEAFGFTDQNLKDLIQATTHHSWQFKKFARDTLNELLKDPDYKKRVKNLTKELNSEELRYLNSIEY
ncbi:aminopeptidase N [Pricia antarctica]|uniref:Aminopeptidase N n=1 Tax=Pricia antarctica TaxID=641691 RepID=A0A1G7B8D3_9FLAO|nr:M1 family metallopeptidase [Pricia antarctica]SDE23107.1 aminopeptidase N [Pricia antarctica]